MTTEIPSAHDRQRARQLVKNAKIRWGHGWGQLSNSQQEQAIGYEVAMLLLTQHESLAPLGSPLARLQAVARAAFTIDRG